LEEIKHDCETNIEESKKVKMFDKFIDDLKKLLK